MKDEITKEGEGMKRKLVTFVVTLVMMAGLAVSARSEAPSMARLLPADSLGYVELSDMEVFYYLISELGAAAVESLDQEAEVPAGIKIKARAILGAFKEIKPLLPKSASLGIISIDERGQPSVVLVAELSAPTARLASAAGKLLALAPQAKVRKTEHGIEIAFPEGRMPPVGVAVVDNVLYAAMGEGLLDRLLSRARSDVLSDTAQFQAVDAITGKNAFISVYANVDAIREKILPAAPPHAQQVAELLGLKDIHAAGVSLAADEELVGFNLALQYTEDAPGIPSFLSIPNTKPKGIAYIPQDFSYVARFSPGPPDELLKKICAFLERLGKGQEVAEGLAQLKERKGIDLEKILASLGGEITFGAKFPDTLQPETIPQVVACLEVRDGEYLIGMLKGLLSGESPPASLTDTEIAGKKGLLMTFKAQVPFQPILVVDNDVIVIGISEAALERALAAKESGENIASKPAFKAAMEGLPAASNVALEYIELEALGKLMLAGLSVAAATAPEPAGPMIAKLLPYATDAVQNLENGAEVIYRTPNGLAIQSRLGTRSVMQILRAGAAVAVRAILLKEIQAPPEAPEEETPVTAPPQ
jgi:hypothetical protein